MIKKKNKNLEFKLGKKRTNTTRQRGQHCRP